jgi:hypothetical protein
VKISTAAYKFGLKSSPLKNANIDDIKNELRKGRPVIVLIDPSYLYGGISGFGHFIVIVGFSDGKGVNMNKEIYELAKEYLIENIGELVSADDVYFDAQQNTWNVKIIAKTPHGMLILGEMHLNKNKKIVDVPTKETLLNILKSKLQEERVLIDVPRSDLARIKDMICGVRVYG